MYAGKERRNRVVALVLAVVLLAGVVLTLVATVVQAAPAHAVALPMHVTLVSSVPATESTLSQVPTEIQLTFDEPVVAGITHVRVIRDGTPVEVAPLVVEGGVVTARIVGAGGNGGYRVIWQTAGPDGHAMAGETTFGVGQPAPQPRVVPTYKTPQSQPTTFGHPDHLPGLIAAGVLLLGGVALMAYEHRRRRRLLDQPNERQGEEPQRIS